MNIANHVTLRSLVAGQILLATAFTAGGCDDKNRVVGSGLDEQFQSQGIWSISNNLFVGNVAKIAVVSKARMLAATSSGIFRSTDTGCMWSGVPGISDTVDVVRLFVDVSGGCMAMTPSGLFVSMDFFEHGWIAADSAFAASLNCVVFTPMGIIAGTDNGILASMDSGRTWLVLQHGLPTRLAVSVVALCRDGTLYAGTEDRGVFISSDGGSHWRADNNGLSHGEAVVSFAMAPDSGTYMLTSRGIYHRSSGSSGWGQLPRLVSYNHGLIAVDSAGVLYHIDQEQYRNPQSGRTTIYGGHSIARSVNMGSTWVNLAAPPTVADVNCLAASDHALFCGTSAGEVLRISKPCR